jgi:hypothetical protein
MYYQPAFLTGETSFKNGTRIFEQAANPARSRFRRLDQRVLLNQANGPARAPSEGTPRGV